MSSALSSAPTLVASSIDDNDDHPGHLNADTTEEMSEMSVILATAGYDHTIRFWEALSGICHRTLQHPESQVNRLCITPDKKYLAAAGRHVVRLYDIKSSNPNPVMSFEGHTANITGIGFHCEGKWMVTSSEDMSIRVWDTRTAAQQRRYECAGPVNDVAIHPNQGELISVDRTGTVSIWDLGRSRRAHSITPAMEDNVSMSSVTVATDGTLLATSNTRGEVYIWRMVSDQDREETILYPCRVFRAHKDIITRVLLSPDTRFLATCSADHTVRIWKIDPAERYLEADADQQEQPQGSGSGTQTPSQADFSPASLDTAAAAMMSSSFQQTTAQTGQQASSAPDMGTDRGVVNLIARRQPLPLETILEAHQRWVWDCAFSADSAYLVTVSSDHSARLWELSSSTTIRQYNGHHRGAVCVALNDYSEPQERAGR